MKNMNLLQAMGRIDSKLIADAAPDVEQKNPKNKTWVKWASFAACFVVLLFAAGFGIYAYSEEVKEYNAAIKFFNEYDLSTNGLTRGEIKKVYRDITTESFSYEKTAEVIANSITSDLIDGFEILQDNPTPEDVKNLWNYKNYSEKFLFSPQKGVHYQYRFEYTGEGQILFEESYLEKYDGETLVWSVAIPEFVIRGYSIISDGVIAYGQTATTSSLQNSYAWMAKFDENGNLVWKNRMNNGFDNEYIAAVLENADGSYAVISYGDFNYFCFSQYSAEGKETHFKKTEMGNYGIWNAARFGDGYIVQLGNHITDEYAKVVKVDHEGNITESFSYSSEDSEYYITDMIEFNGNIYLSAYAIPRLDEKNQGAGGRCEIDKVLKYLFDNEIGEISSEELTPMVRENYTAMLLVCDPDSGTPHEFYLVKGSIGGDLSLSDSGNLLWDVESITTTFFSPATNSFTIGGTCYVFRYTFDDFGILVSQEKTGEVTDYRR